MGVIFLPLKMKTIDYPETSVPYYQSTLNNIPEERRYHVRRGGSLRSHRPTYDAFFEKNTSLKLFKKKTIFPKLK